MTPLVLDQRCITVFHKVQLRGGSMAAATSKMECLVIIVNDQDGVLGDNCSFGSR